MYSWLLRLKNPKTGAFALYEDGPEDIMSVYCALSIASLLNILTPTLLERVDSYVLSCQSYEGGLGLCPGSEAHGAYTYLGLAAALIAKCAHKLEIDKLLVRVIHSSLPAIPF